MNKAQSAIETGHIEPFNYPASSHAPSMPDWPGWIDPYEPIPPQSHVQEHRESYDSAAAQAEFDKRLAEETRRSFEAGRERGRQEGQLAEREAAAAARKAAEEAHLRQHADLVRTFTEAQDRYLHAVEPEVVKLALAVAARILRREAQMDPLLLTGAVRVALGQLSGSTEVRLRVPPSELSLWTEAIALIPNQALKPVVLPGDGMRLGDCVIETSMGSVDLGIRSQLGEIERGFFDRAVAAEPVTSQNHAEPAP